MKVKDVLQLVDEDETVNLITWHDYFNTGGECVNLNNVDDDIFWDEIVDKEVTNIIPDGYDHILIVYKE